MQWLERLYSRKLINVNINILMAGFLALIPLAILVHIVTAYLGLEDKRLITGMTFVADLCFDVCIYYTLHWLANHSARFRRHKPEHASRRSFFKDASLVQFERMTLAPVLYGFALGLQHLLMRDGYSPTLATVIGFVTGIIMARILHTMWLLRQERRSLARYQAGLVPHTPDTDNGQPAGAVISPQKADEPVRIRTSA